MSDPTQPVGAVETTKNEQVAATTAPEATQAPVTSAPVTSAPAAAAPATEAKPAKEKKERKPRADLEHQNGITRPAAGGVTAKVWEIADRLSAAKGSPASRKEVIEEGVKQGINQATLATQYGRWGRFFGLTEQRKADKAAAAAAEAATPAPAPVADAQVEAPKA